MVTENIHCLANLNNEYILPTVMASTMTNHILQKHTLRKIATSNDFAYQPILFLTQECITVFV